MALLGNSFLVDVIVVLISCVTIAYIYFLHAFQYWKRKGVAHPQPTFPFGNMKDFALRKMNLGVFFQHCYHQFPGEKYIGLYQLHKPILLLKDPDIIKKILVTDFHSFHDHSFVIDENLDKLWSRTLILLEGHRWKRMRTKLTPAFSSSKVKRMLPLIDVCTKRLQMYLQDSANKNEDVDVRDVIARSTTEIIASCALGIDCNCLENPNSEFRLLGKNLLDPKDLLSRIKFLVIIFAPSLLRILKMRFMSQKLEDFFRNTIGEIMSYRKAHNVVRNDFVDLLMQIKKDECVEDEDNLSKDDHSMEENLTNDDIIAQALVIFIAGFETSSTTISMALYELALNPSYQEELQEEIDKFLVKHNGSITFEAIQEMTYLDMVVKETLRKHPPVLIADRQCTKEYKFEDSDVVIDKGTAVFVPIYALHHDPIYYPNPQEFDPHRFSKDMMQSRRNFTFLPFIEGPRMCTGIIFGLLQIKMGLISILSRYEVHRSKRTEVPITIDPAAITMAPKNGVWLKISTRRKAISEIKE